MGDILTVSDFDLSWIIVGFDHCFGFVELVVGFRLIVRLIWVGSGLICWVGSGLVIELDLSQVYVGFDLKGPEKGTRRRLLYIFNRCVYPPIILY